MFPLNLLFYFFLLLFGCINGGRVDYNKLELSPGQETGLRVGLWTPEEAPEGDKPSFLHWSGRFVREESSKDIPGEISVIVFHSDDLDYIGYVDSSHQRHFCCSPTLQEEGVCLRPGHVIYQPDIQSPTFKEYLVQFRADETTAVQDKIKGEHTIEKSGIYYIYFINCQGSGSGTVWFTGNAHWMNPFGHLSGEQYYFMPFYGILSVIYIFVGILWFILSAIHWKKLLAIQNCIAGVIALGMIECTVWYFEYLSYNLIGTYHLGAIVVGILVSTCKRTVSRLLVLVVSMGFGVVKANLGTTKYKVLFLGEIYFIFSGAFQILSGNSSAEGLTTMLVIPVAMLDTFFYWWIFLSLVRTIQQLTVRKQTIKLSMYKQLFATLIFSGLISTGVVVYQLVIVLTSSIDDRWKTWWVWEAFWHGLYLLVLVAIAFLWRPTSNNLRYAYAELKDVEEEEMQLVASMTAAGEVSQRGKGSDEAEPLGKEGKSSGEVKVDIPGGPAIIPAFTLEEDEENQTEISKMN